jgi:hypothetical protein
MARRGSGGQKADGNPQRDGAAHQRRLKPVRRII